MTIDGFFLFGLFIGCLIDQLSRPEVRRGLARLWFYVFRAAILMLVAVIDRVLGLLGINSKV